MLTSVDFNTALPESSGHTQVMVVVDCFTKMAVRGALSKKVLVQPDLGQCTSGEKKCKVKRRKSV